MPPGTSHAVSASGSCRAPVGERTLYLPIGRYTRRCEALQALAERKDAQEILRRYDIARRLGLSLTRAWEVPVSSALAPRSPEYLRWATGDVKQLLHNHDLHISSLEVADSLNPCAGAGRIRRRRSTCMLADAITRMFRIADIAPMRASLDWWSGRSSRDRCRSGRSVDCTGTER